jgi:hypothetical protein
MAIAIRSNPGLSAVTAATPRSVTSATTKAATTTTAARTTSFADADAQDAPVEIITIEVADGFLRGSSIRHVDERESLRQQRLRGMKCRITYIQTI